jgi:hypothetical protein
MQTKQTRGSLIFGAILIVIGILLFFGQVVDFFKEGALWPFIVIGVGAAFFAGMVLGGKSTGALAIPGSIITGIGLILLVQNIFGWWETWSFSWALIVTFVGVGIAIYGHWSDRPDSRKGGWDLARVGLILFIIFGTIFEFIFSFIGVSGRQVTLFWPVVLIVIGVLQFLWRAFRLLTRPDEVTGDGRDLGGPIILTGIGVVAALTVLDLMTLSQVLALLGLWPLLLIFAGIQLIVGRQSPWIGAALAILLVAAALTLTFTGERFGIRLGAPTFIIGNWAEDWGDRERVRGNGEIAERTYTVSGFDQVTLNLPGKLEIVQSDSEALTIRGESNLLEYIEANVSGDELEIEARRGYALEATRDLTFLLTVKDLEEVSLTSAGEVTITDLESDHLVLNSSGMGNFRLSDLQAERFDLEISGSGSADVSGQVERLYVQISGAGSFEGADLRSQEAEVNISGLGKATLWVEERLNTSISGAGSISYYGDPSVNQSTSGAGSVNRLGDK